MKAKIVSKLEREAVRVLNKLAKTKPLYEELDDVIQQLVCAGVSAFEVRGKVYTVTDNFADKNTAFKSVAFRRFDIKVTKKVG